MADEHSFHAEVLTPEGKVFEGNVEQLSTRTSVGEIGIQARHVPVLARLEPTELRLISGSDTTRFAQAEGWLQVFANRAIVLVGECVPPSELDTGQLNDRLKDAEQRRDEAEEGTAAHERAERDVLRAETFLELAG
jgi:F-type H+-transporting ATPase subunit epsilon